MTAVLFGLVCGGCIWLGFMLRGLDARREAVEAFNRGFAEGRASVPKVEPGELAERAAFDLVQAYADAIRAMALRLKPPEGSK